MMTLSLTTGGRWQRLLRWLEKFWALESHQKTVLIGAWFLLGWYRFALAIFPLRRLCSSFAHYRGVGATRPSSLAQQEEALAVGRLVATASRVTPWKSQCLVQVLAVQHLLASRRIPGAIHLGVQLHSAGPMFDEALTYKSAVSAHAWLTCGDTVVSGESGCENFSTMSSFSWH